MMSAGARSRRRTHDVSRGDDPPVFRSPRAACADTDHVNENETSGALGFVFLAGGFYATLAGAVARGIQLARR